MKPASLASGPRPVALLALGVSLLCLAAAFPVIVHFYADFDSAPAGQPNGAPPVLAMGGMFEISGHEGAFSQSLLAEDGGVLVIGPNPGPEPAELLADFTEPCDLSPCDISFELVPMGPYSDLILRISDDDGTGMIDVSFDDEGNVHIGGQTAVLPALASGDALDVELCLRPAANERSWSLTIGATSGVLKLTGALGSGAPTVGSVTLVRPGLTLSGAYELDNLLVASPITSVLKAGKAFRSS